jgi:phosphoenolpyruvate---glycerone phosphotransferase subunit DhaL
MLTMDAAALRDALSRAAVKFDQEEARLNALDGAIGDGDHGITVRIGFNAIRSELGTLEGTAPLDAILRRAGMAFMNATGGAIGVIFGKALISGGLTLRGIMQIGPSEFVAMLKSMENAVAAAGKAKPGDKTILDSMHAAAGVTPLPDLVQTMRGACLAAEKGAAETANWPCKVGRASRLGDRSIGHPDPGAVSVSLFLEALLESVEAGAGKRSIFSLKDEPERR